MFGKSLGRTVTPQCIVVLKTRKNGQTKINLVVQCKSQSVGQWFIVSDLEIHSYRISCVFVFLTVQNIIFDVLGPLAFRKYSTCWVFPALHHSVFLYLCLCICVFVYLTVQNIIFDVLGSLAFQKYKYI